MTAFLLRVAALACVPLAHTWVTGCSSGERTNAHGQDARPDIVIVVVDTVRRDRLSSYGYEHETSPHLERLQRSARTYTNAYSTSSWTAPAHASLFTGLYPVAHETTQESWTLRPDLDTLAEVLGEHGYQAVGIAANPMLSRRRGFGQGFAPYEETWRQRFRRGQPRSATSDDVVVDRVRRLLEVRDPAKPLFLFVNLIGPHSPYDSCGEFCGRFVSDDRVKRKANDWPRYYLGRDAPSRREIRHLGELYDAELLKVDAIVGELIDLLERHGLWERSLFVVTSDHGENLGDHGQFDHVFSLYESTIRIPLIIRQPARFEPGSTDPRPVQLTDLFATVLNAAGIEASPGPHHGVDLARSGEDERRPILAEYYRPVQAFLAFRNDLKPASAAERRRLAVYNRRIRSLVQEPYKLIWGSDGRHELYDLAADPAETDDLVERPEAADVLARLLAQLDGVVGSYSSGEPRAGSPDAVDDETRRALESLGYAE